jgi:hypothetical protein
MNNTMKNLLIAFLLLPLFAVAQTKDPIAYNDKIVGYQNDVVSGMLSLNESISLETSTRESIEALRLELVKTAQTSIANTQKMPAYDGSTELRDAAVALFKFYEGVIKDEYKQMIDIVYMEEITEEDYANLNIILQRVTEEEVAFDERFQNAQGAFARKYGLELIENELQEEIDEQ